MGGSIARGCLARPSLCFTRLAAHPSLSDPAAPITSVFHSAPQFPVGSSPVANSSSSGRFRGVHKPTIAGSHSRSSYLPCTSFSGGPPVWREVVRGPGRLGRRFFGVGRFMEQRTERCISRAGPELPPTAVQTVPRLKISGPKLSFCPACGGAIEQRIPDGEHELRAVCTMCGCIHYQNPKMVVGCLVEHEGKVLLCRRSIQPSHGLWTLPAGYMELGESAAEGAARETWEEAQAEVEVVSQFAHLDIPVIGQSYIIFRARLKQPKFSPGPESLECALFALDEIPFDLIAFSSISVALKMYVEDMKAGRMRIHHGVIDKRPGASPSDPQGFVVRDLLSM